MAELISAKDLPITEAEEVDVLCVDNGELKRKQAYSTTSEGTLAVEVNSDGCDKVLLQCRVPASAAYVGKKVVFSNFKFKEVK